MWTRRDRVLDPPSQQLAALLPNAELVASPVAGTWWVWDNRRSSEKRSIGYLSVRRPITGSIHLQRIWSERDVSVDSAATAVRSMIADIDVDPESEILVRARPVVEQSPAARGGDRRAQA